MLVTSYLSYFSYPLILCICTQSNGAAPGPVGSKSLALPSHITWFDIATRVAESDSNRLIRIPNAYRQHRTNRDLDSQSYFYSTDSGMRTGVRMRMIKGILTTQARFRREERSNYHSCPGRLFPPIFLGTTRPKNCHVMSHWRSLLMLGLWFLFSRPLRHRNDNKCGAFAVFIVRNQ